MENIAYYNGKISSIEEMTIPMNERSSYFGDGVYDAMFTVDHVPLQLDDHLRRFYRSAKKIDIDIPMPFEELRAMVLDFCRRIDSPDAMAYVQATRGVGMRNHPYAGAGDKPRRACGSGSSRICSIRWTEATRPSRWRIRAISIATSRRSTCCPPSSTPSGRRRRAATRRFCTAVTA